jgi:cystathionine beta-lyase
MKYDFDQVINRRKTNSLKWDSVGEEVISMALGDMDFMAPEPVVDAIRKRAQSGVYGYAQRPESYYEAIMEWLSKRHNWKIEREWLVYTPGVLIALAVAIRTFSRPGDKIIVQSPVYHLFFNIIKNNGRHVLVNPLKLERGRYMMDFEDLSAKLMDSRVRILLLCSPHNPTGRVWKEHELIRLAQLCLENNVLIISDEVYSDIIFPGNRHIVFANISKEIAKKTITCISPGKTFNLSGLRASSIIISNSVLRNPFANAMIDMDLDISNILDVVAIEAAYRYGDEWLIQLLDYLAKNLDYLIRFIDSRIPQMTLIRPEGTFLAWLDCQKMGMDAIALRKFMLQKVKVRFSEGVIVNPGGKGFQRMNFACAHSLLKHVLENIENAIQQFL